MSGSHKKWEGTVHQGNIRGNMSGSRGMSYTQVLNGPWQFWGVTVDTFFFCAYFQVV